VRTPRSALRLPLLLLAAAAACRRVAPSDPSVAFDPEIVDREPGAFRQTFDGRPGKLVLGTGWYGFESQEKTGPWSGFSWVASYPSVYFGLPESRDVELVARVLPFIYPSAPDQTMTPILNGTELGAVALAPDWREVRVPLPERLLRAPINELRFHFAYTTQASTVIASDDIRNLSVAFDDIAVLPAGQPLPTATSEIRDAGGGRREATLRGSGLAIPLPAGARWRIRFGDVRPSRAGLSISVELAKGDRTRKSVWSGPAERLAGRGIAFSADGQGPAMLLLRLMFPSEPGTPEPSVVVGLTAPEAVTAPAATADRPPDVFLYLIDTLRADALGVYGSTLGATPRIDAFAGDAVTYERAWSPASWTVPATISILSGVYPFGHGVTDLDRTLPDSVPWMPEEFSKQGYDTAAISQWPLGESVSIVRGFGTRTFDVRLSTKSYSELARGLFWQYLYSRPDPGKPLFAYVHVPDPHAVYAPKGQDRIFADRHPGTLPDQYYNTMIFEEKNLRTKPAEVAHLRGLYDGEVLHADRQFGAFLELLKSLGLYDRSVIVLLSDHGEEFDEHGGFDHGRTLYEELLRVPLLVKYPGRRGAGLRIAERVSTVDVAPTLLSLAGRDFGKLRLHGRKLPESSAPGTSSRSLLSEVRVRPSGPTGAVDLAATVLGEIKCIRNALPENRFHRPAPPFEAYDLAADPGEKKPLAPGDPRVGPCRDELARWMERAKLAGDLRGKPIRDLPPEEIQRLRSLGYLQ
jgi:arylsulfatase A-like enzyme